MGLGFALLHRAAGQLLHQHHVGPRIGDGIQGRGSGLLHQHHARQVVEVIVEASALASAMGMAGFSGSRCSIVEAIVQALASCSTSTTSALAPRPDGIEGRGLGLLHQHHARQVEAPAAGQLAVQYPRPCREVQPTALRAMTTPDSTLRHVM